jgi:hypothetical protein
MQDDDGIVAIRRQRHGSRYLARSAARFGDERHGVSGNGCGDSQRHKRQCVLHIWHKPIPGLLNQRSGEPRNGVRQLPISRPRATADPPRVKSAPCAGLGPRGAPPAKGKASFELGGFAVAGHDRAGFACPANDCRVADLAHREIAGRRRVDNWRAFRRPGITAPRRSNSAHLRRPRRAIQDTLSSPKSVVSAPHVAIHWLRGVTDRSALASSEDGAAALGPSACRYRTLTRVATEPPTTRCMTTSPGRSRAIPHSARWIRGASRWLARGPSTNVV